MPLQQAKGHNSDLYFYTQKQLTQNWDFAWRNFFVLGVCFFLGFVGLFFKTGTPLYASKSTSEGFPPHLWPCSTLSLESVKNRKVSYCSQTEVQKESKLSKHWLTRKNNMQHTSLQSSTVLHPENTILTQTLRHYFTFFCFWFMLVWLTGHHSLS